MDNATKAMIAATRFTTDSRASDSKPTEPVSRYAQNLSAIVARAAAIESQAQSAKDLGSVMRPVMELWFTE
jgi:hypothetical protein